MSAIMARQEGRVQLEQSYMRLTFNLAKIDNAGVLSATIEETQIRIKKRLAEAGEVKKPGVEFPRH